MLNNSGGHDRGHDAQNSRNYHNHYGVNNQSQGTFPVSGLHNMSGSYAMQNSIPQARGMGNMANNGPQGQQTRYGGPNISAGLQQVQNRGGLPMGNGLPSQAMNRGTLAASGKQGQRIQGAGISGLGALNQNLQRSTAQSIAGMSNLNQRNLQNLSLGAGGQYGMHHMGSPARSNMGLGNYNSSNGPNQPPSELLSMISKGNNQNQLGGLANLSQQFGHSQKGQQSGMQSTTAGSVTSTQDKEQPAFDASEFPALGGANRGTNFKFANGERESGVEGANLYSNLGLHKGMLHPEFNIQSEEFPALPGGGAAVRNTTDDRQQSDQSAQLANLRQDQAVRQDWNRESSSSVGPIGPQSMSHSRFSQSGASPAPQSSPAQLRQTPNQRRPARRQEEHDRFGLMGLLGVIRMQDPDLTTLALGTDLTTLGLPLNSSDLVYKTFEHPWAESPLRQEPTFSVPDCYKKPAPKLKAGYFQKFLTETLFYIFYSMPGDEAQIFAADELCSRGWGFHKEMKAWLQRVPNLEPVMKTNQMERGAFFIWDTNSWQRIQKDMVLHYDALERAPNLPRASPPNSQLSVRQ